MNRVAPHGGVRLVPVEGIEPSLHPYKGRARPSCYTGYPDLIVEVHVIQGSVEIIFDFLNNALGGLLRGRSRRFFLGFNLDLDLRRRIVVFSHLRLRLDHGLFRLDLGCRLS